MTFEYGLVSFLLFIEELGREVKFKIENPDIRPEFEVIKEYFVRVLKKKLITTKIEIRYADDEIRLASAKSNDISKINSSMIDLCLAFQ